MLVIPNFHGLLYPQFTHSNLYRLSLSSPPSQHSKKPQLLPPLSLLLSSRKRRIYNQFCIRASSDYEVLQSKNEGAHRYSVRIPVGDRHILVETGHIGRQGSGAVTVTDGETVAGNDHGITAFQMDIKVGGISLPIMKQALLQERDGRKHILAEMLKCSPPPSKRLSKHAPLIHVMKVKPEKVNLIIGSGGKKVKSIIEETGAEAIDTQDNGIVKITARDLSSLEKSKAIISSLTMVPIVGDIYRNYEIKSIAPYGVFVERAPGREINEKGQLRLSRRALLPDPNPEKPNEKKHTSNLSKDSAASQKAPDKGKPKKVLSTPKDGLAEGNTEQPKGKSAKSKSAEGNLPDKKVVKKLGSSAKDGPNINKDRTKDSSSKPVISISSKNESALVNGEAKVG